MTLAIKITMITLIITMTINNYHKENDNQNDHNNNKCNYIEDISITKIIYIIDFSEIKSGAEAQTTFLQE